MLNPRIFFLIVYPRSKLSSPREASQTEKKRKLYTFSIYRHPIMKYEADEADDDDDDDNDDECQWEKNKLSHVLFSLCSRSLHFSLFTFHFPFLFFSFLFFSFLNISRLWSNSRLAVKNVLNDGMWGFKDLIHFRAFG